MARYWFGQSPSDWTMSIGAGGAVSVAGGVAVTMWTAETGGLQLTDLLDASGTPITAVTSATGDGALPAGTVPQFQGPDGVAEMWADAGGGVRYRLPASLGADVSDLLLRLADAENLLSHLESLAASAIVTVVYDEGGATWPTRPVIANSRIVYWHGPNATPPPAGYMIQNDQFFGWT